ncbi:MAG: hypothetical protein ACRDTG_01270 [Pseudonocardiaceae bacterium]
MSGVLRYVSDAEAALDEARSRDGIAHLVGPVSSKADALDDCLVDLSWQSDGEHVLIWAGHRQLERVKTIFPAVFPSSIA